MISAVNNEVRKAYAFANDLASGRCFGDGPGTQIPRIAPLSWGPDALANWSGPDHGRSSFISGIKHLPVELGQYRLMIVDDFQRIYW